jgi:hypothetical protein
VLDEVPPAGAVLGGIGEESAHHVELVVTRPDLHRFLLPRLLVPGLDDLGVVLEDVGKPFPREDAPPEVVGLEAVRVRRVPRAFIPTLVEGQEPRGLVFEPGAEAHLVVVHGEVHHAAPELEELLAGLAIALVLLNGVPDGLLRQAVLELEGGYRQAVDEQAKVEREQRLVAAVA